MSLPSGRWPGLCLWAMTGAVVTSLMSGPASGVGFDRGRALYENHCTGCHEEKAHTRGERTVHSLEGLRRRVKAWSVHTGLEWDDEDVDDVTRYLNHRFYHFHLAE